MNSREAQACADTDENEWVAWRALTKAFGAGALAAVLQMIFIWTPTRLEAKPQVTDARPSLTLIEGGQDT